MFILTLQKSHRTLSSNTLNMFSNINQIFCSKLTCVFMNLDTSSWDMNCVNCNLELFHNSVTFFWPTPSISTIALRTLPRYLDVASTSNLPPFFVSNKNDIERLPETIKGAERNYVKSIGNSFIKRFSSRHR